MATNLQLSLNRRKLLLHSVHGAENSIREHEQHIPVSLNRTLRKIKLVNESPVKDEGETGHALRE